MLIAIDFLKSVVFMVCEHKYMNICPSAPPPINDQFSSVLDYFTFFKITISLTSHCLTPDNFDIKGVGLAA